MVNQRVQCYLRYIIKSHVKWLRIQFPVVKCHTHQLPQSISRASTISSLFHRQENDKLLYIMLALMNRYNSQFLFMHNNFQNGQLITKERKIPTLFFLIIIGELRFTHFTNLKLLLNYYLSNMSFYKTKQITTDNNIIIEYIFQGF